MSKQNSNTKPTRKQETRKEKEAHYQRIMLWIVGSVLAVILVVIGYGLIVESSKANTPIAMIDNTPLTTKEYQQRLYYERKTRRSLANVYQTTVNNYFLESSTDPENTELQDALQYFQYQQAVLEQELNADMTTVLGGAILDSMIEEKLVRQEATKRGLSVDAAELQSNIEFLVGYQIYAPYDPEVARAQITDTDKITLDQEFSLYKASFLSSGFSEADFRAMAEANLLKQVLMESLSEDMETEADQVEVTIFIAGTLEEALDYKARIEAGEDIEALSEALSNDENEVTSSRVLPWLPLGYLSQQYTPEIEKAAFSLPVGAVSEPLQGNNEAFYTIYVKGHEERELSDDLLLSERQEQYTQWLEQQKAERTEYLLWKNTEDDPAWMHAVLSTP